MDKKHQILWERAWDVLPEAELYLEEPSVQDVMQGQIGNCWLKAAIASLAENPQAVIDLYVNTGNMQSEVGMYGVNLFVLGHPMTILVDDYLPVIRTEAGLLWLGRAITGKLTDEKKTIFSKARDKGSLWVLILEKVFAKRYGNYQHLESGDPADGMRALTGGPNRYVAHKNSGINKIWNLLKKHTVSDYIQVHTKGNDD